MKKLHLFAAFLCLLLSIKINAQTSFYVSHNGDDNNVGSTWATSFRNISKALTQANLSSDSSVTIYIGEGIYKPTDGLADTLNRDTAFVFIRTNYNIPVRTLKILGSYDPLTGLRDDSLHATYLDGNIGNVDSVNDNSYHVILMVKAMDVKDTIIIDGFCIRNGYAYATDTLSKRYEDIVVPRNYGGGLFVSSDALINYWHSFENTTFRNCVFVNNASSGLYFDNYFGNGGAAAFVSGASPKFESCIFNKNSGSSYVAFAAAGATTFSFSYSTIVNCIFKENGGSVLNDAIAANGGAISCGGQAFISIEHCYFSENKAFLGGAIEGGQIVRIRNCIFNNNYAKSVGGALVLGGTANGCDVSNNLFINNIAPEGSVLYTDESSNSKFLNNTCFGNVQISDTGTAIYTPNDTSSLLLIANSVFYNNKNNLGISEISTNFQPATIRNCNIESGFSGNGNINAAPLFVDTSNLIGLDSIWGTSDDGLRLAFASPCINAGDNTLMPDSLYVDFAGAARVQQNFVDMGAYEQPGSNMPVAIKNVNEKNHFLQIYPNPANDYFYISTDNKAIDVLTISDVTGKEMYRWNGKNLFVKNGVVKMNVPRNIVSGMYLLQAHFADGTKGLAKLSIQ